jgi:DNA-binding transcriptional regulator YhcF (GntR family)
MIFHRKPGSVRAVSGGYNFTERVRSVLQLARTESVRLHHQYVGTEHILLGLILEGGGVATTVLWNLHVKSDQIQQQIEEMVKPGKATQATGPDLPYTSRAKKVLELAMSEARELHHSYVGTEHLLLGLLREEKGIAAQVLTKAGLTIENARAETLRLLGSEAERTPTFSIQIDDMSSRSIYEQIIDQIQEAIATNALQPNDRLPTVRQLADQLDIAPGTVARAYSDLEQQGIVVTDGARGTRVAQRGQSAVEEEDARLEGLLGLLRPVAVEAFHMGASADEVRHALERAMHDILK